MKRSDLSPAVQRTLRRYPSPFDSHYGVSPEAPPDAPLLGPAAARHEGGMRALARLEALSSELNDPWLVSRLLVRQEAVSSSAIEGTNSTLDALLEVEETGDAGDAEGTQGAAARQVWDYASSLAELIPQARAQGPSIFTEGLVYGLHRAVMRRDGAYTGVAGELRHRVVWIGGRGDIAYSTFNPAHPEDVAGCLADNLSYMRGDGAEALQQSVIVRMAVAHAHFEAVHPFVDGNGRVGRLMMPLMMAAAGQAPLYLSHYIDANRPGYYAALKAAQQRLEWHEMVGYLAEAVTGTVAELLATRTGLARLRVVWLERRRFRAGSGALRALDLLPHYPVITVRRLATMLSVSWPQAAQAIEQLISAGILQERTGYRRNRLFVAREALSIVNRPYGEEPVLPGSG